MALKLNAFGFDGALVDSNELKHNAYIKLFLNDDCYKGRIPDVSVWFFEESRWVIIAKALMRANWIIKISNWQVYKTI